MLENVSDSSIFEPKFLPKSFFNSGLSLDDSEHCFVDDIEYQTLSSLFKTEDEEDDLDGFNVEVSQAMASVPNPSTPPSKPELSSGAVVDILTPLHSGQSQVLPPSMRLLSQPSIKKEQTEAKPTMSPLVSKAGRRGRPPKTASLRPPLTQGSSDYMPITSPIDQLSVCDTSIPSRISGSLSSSLGMPSFSLQAPPTSSSVVLTANRHSPGAVNHGSPPGFNSMWPAPMTLKPPPTMTPITKSSAIKRSLSSSSIGDEVEDEVERKERRRERNRLLARKTRMRKKFFFESLQRKAALLREENSRLKRVVEDRLPNEASQILSECHTSLPQVVVDCTEQANTMLTKPDHTLMALLQDVKPAFCITDPKLPDNPIVFASDNFMRLTGYTRNQVIGRNCRFLQGPRTDQTAVHKLRDKIKEGSDVSVLFLNYKADGTPFWNNVFIAALRDPDGNIVNYVGVQHPVDAKNIPEHCALK